MIKKQILMVLFLSIPILNDLEHLVVYSVHDPNINLTISLKHKEYNQNNIKGIQFEIVYEPEKIVFNELTSLIDGAIFEYVSSK